MHDNILSEAQRKVLPFIDLFAKSYYLVGGTAISLQIGHRQSIDFDMFTYSKVQKKKILDELTKMGYNYSVLFTDSESIHFLVENVKITFFQYPFKVPAKILFDKIKMPDLLHLAAMKAYALGRRSKWKDYVDLYFLLKKYYTLDQIADKASEIFGELFSKKMFKIQLCYFKDIDYSEEVFYMENQDVPENEVVSFLTELATNNIE